MAEVLGITAPVYLIIALGWACVRWGLFERAEMRVLGRFVISIALPALLLHTLSSRHLRDILNPVYLAAFTGGSLVVLLGGYAWSRRRGGSHSRAAIVAMGMSCSNSGFFGFPLASQFIGPDAGIALALCMLVENVLVLPLLLALADLREGPSDGMASLGARVRVSLVGLARNPMILAIAAGIVLGLLEWTLPAPVGRAVGLLASASAGLALFVLGASLGGQSLRGQGAEVTAIAVGKLVLHPLAVGVLVWCLPPMARELQAAAVLFAAVPMLGVYPILAQRHGHDGLSAVAQLVVTLGSFVTLTTLLWVLRPG
jgi:predicted permease